jgi:hypothetical protein
MEPICIRTADCDQDFNTGIAALPARHGTPLQSGLPDNGFLPPQG